jgi:hypothetical protein
MATVADVENLLDRARRFQARVLEQQGPGASWSYTFPDGLTEKYTIRGLQSVEHLEDDVASLFVWAWSTKDHLKELARTLGKPPQRVEDLVERTPALCLLGDVANALKHLELRRRTHSGFVPHLGRPKYSMDLRSLKSLQFSVGEVAIEPKSSEDVGISYPILDPDDNVVGDAIVLLSATLSYWEQELAALRG